MGAETRACMHIEPAAADGYMQMEAEIKARTWQLLMAASITLSDTLLMIRVAIAASSVCVLLQPPLQPDEDALALEDSRAAIISSSFS